MVIFLEMVKVYGPQYPWRQILIREAHSEGLMRHFGIHKASTILQEQLIWPKMKNVRKDLLY